MQHSLLATPDRSAYTSINASASPRTGPKLSLSPAKRKMMRCSCEAQTIKRIYWTSYPCLHHFAKVLPSKSVLLVRGVETLRLLLLGQGEVLVLFVGDERVCESNPRLLFSCRAPDH